MRKYKSQFITTLQRLNAVCTRNLRGEFLLLCVFNVVMAFFEMAVAGGISLLGIAMASPHALERIPYFMELRGILHFSENIPEVLMSLILVMAIITCATVGKNIFLAYLTWRQTIFSQKMAWMVGNNLFQKFLYAPYIWHVQQNSSDLINYISWKSTLSTYIINLLILCTQLIITISLLSSALYANMAMSFLLFVSIGILALVIYKATRTMAYDCGNRLRDYDLKNSRIVMQGLHGLREVAIADKQQSFLSAYRQFVPVYTREFGKQSLFSPLPIWVLESAGMILLLAVLLILTSMGYSVAETTGTLMLLAAISWRLLPAANKALGALLALKGQQAIVEQVLNRLQESPVSGVSATGRTCLKYTQDIVADKISFRYPQATTAALHEVSLRIAQGTMVGLVGLSGSGKSTLTGILTGLLQPDSGEIRVDGSPFQSSEARLALGYVPQSLYLLDASLADNVAFRVWGEPVDEEKVRRCCAMAAMDFINDLPEGINTVLGERGVRLSGGQIQRVGIARALYANPELLIFDEATSALDGATEQAIQHTIDSLRDSMTLLIIAHRLTTVQHCDHIYWLDNGKIRMEGKPELVLPAYSAYLDEQAAQSEQKQQ